MQDEDKCDLTGAAMTSFVHHELATGILRVRVALTLIVLAALAVTQSVHAQTLRVLHVFIGEHGDGAFPTGGLVRDSAGALYGTTEFGGSGVGTVFKLSLRQDGGWAETILHAFEGGDDGFSPEGRLVLETDGTLYGVTTFGGGEGTVFKITKTGKKTTLYRFCFVANCADGSGPTGGLAQDVAGNLYGTTILGGDS